MPVAAFLMTPASFKRHIHPGHIDRLARSCTLAATKPFASASEVAAAAPGVEILITGWGSPWLGLESLNQFPNLRLVAHAAGSLKSIVDPALLSNGVTITSAAAANAQPVAEFSLSWILRWNKRLDEFEREYRARRGSLDILRNALNFGNYGATVGIISASHVGRALLQLLQPFEIDCLLYDPYVPAGTAPELGATRTELLDLLARSDVVSLNAPLLPATEKMIGAEEFGAMKDGALFMNTARGRIVDHEAMIEALSGGRISAVIDVTHPEPLPADDPLWNLPNVYLTPHVAGSLGLEVQRMTDWCIAEVERFVRGEQLIAAISPQNWEHAA